MTAKGERLLAATIYKRHGAYLVSWDHHPVADNATGAEMYDATGSFVAARRLAVEGARQFGYAGAVRWSEEEYGWELEMTWPDDDEGDVGLVTGDAAVRV